MTPATQPPDSPASTPLQKQASPINAGGEPDRAHSSAALIPMGRPGTADEVAAAIVWLLSDAASYTTGTVLDVSGGR